MIFYPKISRIFSRFPGRFREFFIHNLLTYFDKALWLMTFLKISVFLLDIKPCQVQNTTSQQTIGGLAVNIYCINNRTTKVFGMPLHNALVTLCKYDNGAKLH